ncbi:peptidyl-tRNA hydrolase [Kalaharituber pfeilii]|nr:peptidyl-tRNA hydrolase [Kalaharituber pfeilii]
MPSLDQPVSTHPTVLAVIIATSIISGVTGYFIGLGSTLGGISHGSRRLSPKPASSSEDEVASDGEDGEQNAGDTKDFSDVGGECKLTLVVRTDLNMTKGKVAAQCGHATLACYKSLAKSSPALLRRWETTGQAKIALRVDSEEEMLILQAQAQSLGITATVIHDAGRTQIAAVRFLSL